jgi:hypothetical protein
VHPNEFGMSLTQGSCGNELQAAIDVANFTGRPTILKLPAGNLTFYRAQGNLTISTVTIGVCVTILSSGWYPGSPVHLFDLNALGSGGEGVMPALGP